MLRTQQTVGTLFSFRGGDFVSSQKLLTVGYFVLAVAAVLLMHCMLPPFAAPDEFAHLFHAASLASGQLVPRPGSDGIIGGGVDTSIVELFHVLGPTAGHGAPMPADALAKAAQIARSGSLVFVSFPNTGQCGPILYLPQAIGLAIGRNLGLSVISSYDLARLLSALVTIGIAAVAIANAARGAFVLAVVLTSPMFLFLATSLSQDGLLVAVSALFAVLVGTPQPPTSRTRNWIAWLCALLMAMARPPYAALSGLLTRERNRRSFMRWLSAPDGPIAPIAVCGITIGWLAAAGALQQPDFAADPGVNSRAQLAQMLHHPWSMFEVAYATFAEHDELRWKAHEVIARLNVSLPEWIYTAGEISILLAAGTCLIEPPTRSLLYRVAAIVVFVLSVGGIYAAMYLTWTPVGQKFIEGVQGRYFLPLIVGLPLIIPMIISVRWSAKQAVAPTLEGVKWVAGLASWGLMIAVTVEVLVVLHSVYGGPFRGP
jgi:uncharacterized membrane protein